MKGDEKYIVMEFVDGGYEICNSLEEAEKAVGGYEEAIMEIAERDGEFDPFSRVILAEIVEDRQECYNEEKGHHVFKTVYKKDDFR